MPLKFPGRDGRFGEGEAPDSGGGTYHWGGEPFPARDDSVELDLEDHLRVRGLPEHAVKHRLLRLIKANEIRNFGCANSEISSIFERDIVLIGLFCL